MGGSQMRWLIIGVAERVHVDEGRRRRAGRSAADPPALPSAEWCAHGGGTSIPSGIAEEMDVDVAEVPGAGGAVAVSHRGARTIGRR